MKFAAALLAFAASITYAVAAKPQGIDVSSWQPNVNWTTVKNHGVQFAYIKATEGTTYKSSKFSSQYIGAYNKSIIHGAYHFARPEKSSGAAQAKFFLAHGGGWSADGKTLPGALDLESTNGVKACYGLSHAKMVAWIKDFSNTYHAKTKRYPVLYTTTSWWKECTGNSKAFGTTNPLWLARYSSKPGELPAGWPYYTFWQYSDKASVIGSDANVFNGDSAALKRMAKGS